MSGLPVLALPTTWDGHVRVDYLPDWRLLQVTLITGEPAVEAALRRDLRAGFVLDDPEGPPAFVAVTLPAGRLHEEVRHLLGEQIVAIAEQVVAGPPHTRWTRLDVLAVDQLAAIWAPYRVWVLATAADEEREQPREPVRAVLGRWAGGFWARLGVEELRRRLTELPQGELVMLGSADPHDDTLDDEGDRPEAAPVVASGRWELPIELAERARVEPGLEWEIRDGAVHIIARQTDAGPGGTGLLVSFDDGTQGWTRLEEEPSGVLRAEIASAADPDRLPPVRIRTEEQ
ncbi:hypothetical protein AB1484_33120 [Parafrankia sp. FMc6]|uniref:hypothetical protein n=1 Tax=Parafrankia soli TaxID=2599596 RepID=UPI0034D66AA7